ncbi:MULTISPECIES: alpha/beta hydrolase [unclassified Mesorhizobium]|uniref:alpha/beta hydrolase n=1 Tax=unclassified Mesorhizobium TaxID=325217 RepID=UPI000FCA6C41|nr:MULTISPECIES: alpha/beta hydrolase [unclassified Mesorhizobium]RUU84042.1 alpha/beta hydrolase [Mesorhizobium sp. M7A.T.Ca.TU.009.01.1.2]RUT83054.1 alpha/beta hydrolase [Mesorhizobium sp. M7A.T.Ca.US.000.02.1.1]RUT87484.1 alpha/beta hydrolase [Mesorhizobium sp. M7A.T.Ca.US.000.02.2.1]RUT97504.1 alpha/beta hydrolase [Mesorhizobium sp. M7A.T.Ca.TU.009.02.1.1]RUV39215.1 alpha/beta hydrolase [Mesorhizobium sp. M7A.F.Ca.MR.148.00.0.0]
MFERHIVDWDDAYANGANIAGSDRWPAAWVEPAQAFRDALSAQGRARLDITYGDGRRNRLDLFLPSATPKGLVVFIHGGYWKAFDKSFWSHLANGAVSSGFAVAMPSYTLCPDLRIAGIVQEIGVAIGKAAAMVDGPLMLTGHSAGGHLASRMVTTTTPLADDVARRVRHVVSISGVHDLRPIMRTEMNATLAIDEAEALAESPALLRPMDGVRITCWAGGGERAEFLRQNALLANIWTGLGAATSTVVEPDRHHFSIVDGLADPAHPLSRALISG